MRFISRRMLRRVIMSTGMAAVLSLIASYQIPPRNPEQIEADKLREETGLIFGRMMHGVKAYNGNKASQRTITLGNNIVQMEALEDRTGMKTMSFMVKDAEGVPVNTYIDSGVGRNFPEGKLNAVHCFAGEMRYGTPTFYPVEMPANTGAQDKYGQLVHRIAGHLSD